MCDIPTLVATIVTVSTSVALSVEQAKTQATQANRQQNAITAAELVQQKQLQERAGQEGEEGEVLASPPPLAVCAALSMMLSIVHAPCVCERNMSTCRAGPRLPCCSRPHWQAGREWST